MGFSRPVAALGAATLIASCTPADPAADEAEAIDPRTDEAVLVAVVAGEPDLLDPAPHDRVAGVPGARERVRHPRPARAR